MSISYRETRCKAHGLLAQDIRGPWVLDRHGYVVPCFHDASLTPSSHREPRGSHIVCSVQPERRVWLPVPRSRRGPPAVTEATRRSEELRRSALLYNGKQTEGGVCQDALQRGGAKGKGWPRRRTGPRSPAGPWPLEPWVPRVSAAHRSASPPAWAPHSHQTAASPPRGPHVLSA